MFYRNALNKLKKWKESNIHKPLVIQGARQIGKTTAIRLFSENFDNYIELNLEKKEDRRFFEQELPISKILEALALKHKFSFKEGSSLIFIDEIQNSKEAVAYLRYFFEEYSEIHVIAAGSLLENLITKKKISFPVGRVEYLFMYPCSFDEFLGAIGKSNYLDYFQQIPFPEHLVLDMFELFNRYILIGGMPEVVAKYSVSENVADLQDIYKNLLVAYLDDVEKYAPKDSLIRVIRHIINNAPFQSGCRIKFQGFGNSNYSSREVGDAMRILEKALLIDIFFPTTSIQLPIQPDIKKAPKVQFFDVGLTNFLTGLQSQLVTINDFSKVEKGRIVENVVYQELKAHGLTYGLNQLSFWVREKKQATSEIDFVYPYKNKIIPIEIKSGNSGRLRSLAVFMDMADHKYAVRLYSGELKVDQLRTLQGKSFKLLNLPYFLAGSLERYLEWFVYD